MAGDIGDRSYHKLIVNIYGMNKTNKDMVQKYKENDIAIQMNNIMLQLHFSYFLVGAYGYGEGDIFGFRGREGFIRRRAANGSITQSQLLDFRSTGLHTRGGGGKGYGWSVRCGGK